MRERPWLDVSALRPLEGLLLAAQQALMQARLRETDSHVLMSLEGMRDTALSVAQELFDRVKP